MNLTKRLTFFPKANGREWHVTTATHTHDLIFRSRALARLYKQLLKESNQQIPAQIVAHEYFDDYIEDKKTS